MDFELDDDQRALLDAVEALLARHAGPARAVGLYARGETDLELETALEEAGFLDALGSEGMGALEAVLVVEAVARAGGLASVGARALVAPLLRADRVPGPVALADAARPGPARFAAQAQSVLVIGEEEARLVALAPGRVPPVASSFGYPMGRLDPAVLAGGRGLGVGSRARMQSAWRLAVAAEAVGCMGAALDHTVAYLKERRQFGRAIGSFQAVQHRLAHCKIEIEGSRWLAYEAASRDGAEESAAGACAYALSAARRVFRETHQLSGAIGFTREHDLHVWTMRLKALELELGGLAAQRRGLAAARWGGAAQ